MPTSAKKRKAKSSTKKKMQQKGGEAETHINGDDYSTGSHPTENDEVKSIEERESDGAEEAVEKKDVEEAEVEEGAKEVEESVVEPPLETMDNEVETIVEEAKGDPVLVTEVNGDDGVTVESSLGYDAFEDGVSNGVGVVGDEVVDVVEEKREPNEVDDNIVVTESPVDVEVVKPSEYLAEEAIDVPAGASIEEVLDLIEERIVGDESLKQAVAPAEEAIPITEIPPVETSEIADPVEPELKDNGVEAPSELSSDAPISFEPDLSSDGVIDLSESTNGDKLAVPSAIDTTAVVDDEQSETKVIEPVVETTDGADVVKELETLEQSEAKVDAPVIVMAPEAETATDVKIQENSEVQTVDATTVTRREVGDVKSLEVPDSAEREPLTSSPPLAGRRTSWMNCCGLFELFQGANR
ncbi:hypothetical protein AKJ16_DCAP04633 [Drosera capensis]